MTDMDNKYQDIAMAICCIMLTSVFAFGMIDWPNHPKDGTWIGNLYYVTISSVAYVMSVIIFICAKGFWWKAASAIMMATFCTNLYVELYLDPTHWTNWDMWLLIIVGGNTLLVMFIVEKIK